MKNKIKPEETVSDVFSKAKKSYLSPEEIELSICNSLVHNLGQLNWLLENIMLKKYPEIYPSLFNIITGSTELAAEILQVHKHLSEKK
jgi:response regulator RpfG family c-di-GMP phosphodiesterase